MSIQDRPDQRAVLEEFSRLVPSLVASIGRLQAGEDEAVYVIGKNAESEAIIGRIAVAGIIDDFAPRGASWNGVPLVSGDHVPPGSLVINTSTSISPLSTRRRIEAIPGARALTYADLIRSEVLGLPLPAFVAEARAAFAENEARWRAVYDRLADAESKTVFEKLFAYRLTADATHMEGFRVAFADQYFEPFAAPPPGAVFVDCGGFDGDTTEEFVRRHPDYGRVHLFEPSPINFAKAQVRLAGVRDVTFVPLGVSDAPARLSFDPDAGSASAVSGVGEASIEVTTLDAALAEPATFIKMDLEGWEIPALKGSARHIVEDRPILAIAVYHRVSDFWEIPEYVLSLGIDYDLHLRHYTEGWSETIMYFVPKPV